MKTSTTRPSGTKQSTTVASFSTAAQPRLGRAAKSSGSNDAKPARTAQRVRPALGSDTGSADVVALVPKIRRAYEMLAVQPTSLAGLVPLERDRVVVTAVADDLGCEYVVSRFGDAVWDLRSLFKVQNRCQHQKTISWPADVPVALIDDAKAALYAWLKRGKPGRRTPDATSLWLAAVNCSDTLRYLAARGVGRFDLVRQIHISDYFEQLKVVEKLARSTLWHRMQVIELIRVFAQDVRYPLTIDPWAGKSFHEFIGMTSDLSSGKTPVIPPSVQQALFNHAEAVLRAATALLDARDAGKYNPFSSRLLSIRDAVLYLLQVSTGMRNSESTGVKNGSWTTQVKDGITFHWVQTREHKTGKGLVEFLAPPEALQALDILKRWAQPYQARLQLEIRRLEDLLAQPGALAVEGETPSHDRLSNGTKRTDALQRLEDARASATNLFLGITGLEEGDGFESRSCVAVMSNKACNHALGQLAKTVGVDWKPRNHECRRTFAWTVAQSRMGRYALVFLKWQFKHSSMSMTQLYGANPRQDVLLYEDLYEEIVAAQAEVMTDWFDEDVPLAGGVGKKIKEFRGIAIRDRKSMLTHTAAHVNIRNNGHAWCLAEQRGCGGEGLYEASLCPDCSKSVIDQSHAPTWQRIHLLNLELGQVNDCGEGARQRAAREIEISARVLQELGVPVPQIGDEIADRDEL